MGFHLVKGDLVAMNVDAIVSNANINLKMVEGVNRAIFHKAGDINMMEACRKIGRCDVGKAVITPSFDIKTTKAIIHAVGPNYINGKHGEEKNLRSAYQSVFDLMKENKLYSVAFPLLSSDFNYPVDECYKIAKEVILENIKKNPKLEVYLVFFKNIFNLVNSSFKEDISNFLLQEFPKYELEVNPTDNNLKGLKFIEEKEIELSLKDEDLEFKGNLDFNTILKLKNDQNYLPNKNTVYGIGLALNLNEEEFLKLLSLFGYYVQFNTTKLAIIRYFIKNNNYDVYKLNDCLFDLSLQSINSK